MKYFKWTEVSQNHCAIRQNQTIFMVKSQQPNRRKDGTCKCGRLRRAEKQKDDCAEKYHEGSGEWWLGEKRESFVTFSRKEKAVRRGNVSERELKESDACENTNAKLKGEWGEHVWQLRGPSAWNLPVDQIASWDFPRSHKPKNTRKFHITKNTRTPQLTWLPWLRTHTPQESSVVYDASYRLPEETFP